MEHDQSPATGPTRPALGRLDGRRILITGAASGIGRATAELFAAEGANLVLLDLDASKLPSFEDPTKACRFAADVTDEDAVRHAVEEGAAALGGLDGVVNVAGVHRLGSIEDVSVADFRRVVDINLVAIYIVVKHSLAHLKREEGSTIVNVASAAAFLPSGPDMTAYAASKGGAANVSRAMAMELAPSIRVNSLCPGLTDTQMAVAAGTDLSLYALGRKAAPIEIARSALFLTSSESSYMTGAALVSDGGRVFH